MIIQHCINDLLELQDLLLKLSNQNFNKPSVMLSEATIGQHTRHILEFYGCLLTGDNTNSINYDKRKRAKEVESNIKDALNYADQLLELLSKDIEDCKLHLENDFSVSGKNNELISTSLFRELAYCLEHSIHHKALIKVGLREQGIHYLIDNSFGVAPATLRNNKKLVER